MQLDPKFQERIAVIVTVIVGILGAIYLGKMTAQGQVGAIAMILFGAVGVASLIHFRDRVWVLIPVLWPFYGAVQILPLPFALKDLGVIVAFSAIIACIALKIVRFKPRFTHLDALLYINAIWLFTVFIRNPVGFLVSDSERVGGRPYVTAIFGFLAYWTLTRLRGPVSTVRRVPMYVLGAVCVLFAINVVLIFVPAFAQIASEIYTGFDFYFVDGTSSNVAGAPSAGTAALDSGTARIELFSSIGKYSCIFLCAYFFPPSLFNPIHWKRCGAFFAAMTGLLLSGFRSFLMYSGGMFLLGSYYRKGWVSVFQSSAVAYLSVFIIMLGHGTVYELPFAVQRALAVIPNVLRPTQLDERAIEAGESSTDWRVEMWILALTTDRYITDKVMGDGFGMTKMQITAYQRAASLGSLSFQDSQEHMAIGGEFHSGPVSTIRVIGYVGLVFFYLLMVAMAIHASKLIRRARGTPLFPTVLFFCMPVVFEPIWFTFVFGAYGMAFPFLAVSLGMIKLIENSLDELEVKSPVPAFEGATVHQLQTVP